MLWEVSLLEGWNPLFNKKNLNYQNMCVVIVSQCQIVHLHSELRKWESGLFVLSTTTSQVVHLKSCVFCISYTEHIFE